MHDRHAVVKLAPLLSPLADHLLPQHIKASSDDTFTVGRVPLHAQTPEAALTPEETRQGRELREDAATIFRSFGGVNSRWYKWTLLLPPLSASCAARGFLAMPQSCQASIVTSLCVISIWHDMGMLMHTTTAVRGFPGYIREVASL